MIFNVSGLTLNNTIIFDQKLSAMHSDQEVIFDFSNTRVCDPLPMLTIGAIIRRYKEEHPNIRFYIRGHSDMTYAGTMGFFKYLSPLIPVGKEPGEAKGGKTYIPITKLSITSLREVRIRQGICSSDGDIIEIESKRLATIIDQGDSQLHILLTYLIREIIRNIPEHAETDQVWVCGQYWPSYRLAEIAIMDEGIGIYKSISRNSAHRNYITDNKSALEWALRAGISQAIAPSMKQNSNDEWANSGFGLYMVSQICKRLNGSFSMISYDDYIQLSKNITKCGKTSFHGTAIGIRVPSIQGMNAQQIISEINAQGELEARQIRNAFKASSKPSKGLIV